MQCLLKILIAGYSQLLANLEHDASLEGNPDMASNKMQMQLWTKAQSATKGMKNTENHSADSQGDTPVVRTQSCLHCFILGKLIAVERAAHYTTQISKNMNAAYARTAVPNMKVANSLHVIVELVNKRYSSWNLETSDVIIGHIIQYLHQCLSHQRHRSAAAHTMHCIALSRKPT